MAAAIVARAARPRDTVLEIPPPPCKPASLHLLADPHKYLTRCVPLCNAATQVNWSATKKIMLHEDDSIKGAAITKGSQYTVLHIAASIGHSGYMKKLLTLLENDHLYMLDQKGNAAFCLVVAAGKVCMAKSMLRKDPLMAGLKCAEGWSQLRLATYHGHGKMAWFLYPKIIEGLEQGERVATFFNCINSTDTALSELALKMLLEYPELAEARANGATAFHVLAGKPSAFRSAPLKRFLYSGLGKQLKTPALQILKELWNIVSKKDETTVKGILTMTLNGKPSNALFIAAECGNVEFLAELFVSDPALKFEKDDCNRNVFHIGAMSHQWSIFSLADKLGPDEKYSILSAVDNEGNTILHLAAKVAKLKWDEMVGPEVQMKRDLKGFKEVRKVVPPGCPDMRNLEGKTPGDIFSEQHGALNDLLVNKKEMSWTTLVTIIASYFGIGGASFGAATFVLQQVRGK